MQLYSPVKLNLVHILKKLSSKTLIYIVQVLYENLSSNSSDNSLSATFHTNQQPVPNQSRADVVVGNLHKFLLYV